MLVDAFVVSQVRRIGEGFLLIKVTKTCTPSYETQKVIVEKGGVVIVESCTLTPKIPFGDSFNVVTRYCLSSTTPSECNFLVTMEVSFTQDCLLEGKNYSFA